jgi:DegV family protein with EDD domain
MTLSKIKIVTDSSSDLCKSEADCLGVTVVPLSVSFGPQIFYDGDLSSDEYWDKAKGPFWPATSQPSVGAFERAFASLVDAGHHVLCLTLTSHHSGTHSSASTAAQKFGDKVSVIDSCSVSAGLTWQVIAAAEAAGQGRNLKDIVAITRDMARRTHLLALLDTIENVRRGGRVDRVMPLLGRLMQVFDMKPMLTMVDGELKLVGTSRSYEKGLKRIQEEVTALTPIEKIAVIHTRAPDKAAAFADVLADIAGLPREEISILELGVVISCHAGPGVIGVFVLSGAPSSHEGRGET